MRLASALPLLLMTLTLSDTLFTYTNAFTVTSSRSSRISTSASASVSTNTSKRTSTSLYSAAPSDVESSSEDETEDETEASTTSTSTSSPYTMIPNRPTLSARDELLRTATTLTEESPTGLFLTVPSQASDFTRAVARLEAIAPSTNDESEALSIGDWTLVATCKRGKFPGGSGSGNGKKEEKKNANEKKDIPMPTFLTNLPKPPNFSLPPKSKLAKDLQSSITVTQRIRSMTEASQSTNTIDRIDHVIAFDNQAIMSDSDSESTSTTLLPPILNPLKINQSKFILNHNAKVQSFVPFITSLNLQSIIVNVAGEEGSALKLDPAGADVLGINVPQLTEFMNGGNFETTYVDGNVRVSRGTSGLLEETRVFVKQGFDLDSILTALESESTSSSSSGEEEEEGESSGEETETTVSKSKDETQLNKIAKAVGGVVDALDKTSKDVRETIQTDLETTRQDVQKVLEEDLKSVEEAITSVKSAVIDNEDLEEAVDNVVGAVGDLSKDVREVVDGAVDDLKTKVDDDTKKIQSAVEDVKSVVEGKSKEEEQEDETKDEDEDVVAEEEEEEKEETTSTSAEKTDPEKSGDK